jgi:hypothetical protein
MAKALGEPADQGLSREELEKLERYIERARLVTPLHRDELKAVVQLSRAARKFKGNGAAQPAIMPEIYGNHMVVPEDWRPSSGTEDWMRGELKERGVDFDLDWVVAEFVSYWRSRGKPMANWQQCFRNNVLTKLGRGIALAPQAGLGRPVTHTRRVYDRGAELAKQQLGDFDQHAERILRSRRGRGKAAEPLGPADRGPAGEDPER